MTFLLNLEQGPSIAASFLVRSVKFDQFRVVEDAEER
jgi:hypothetical protein